MPHVLKLLNTYKEEFMSKQESSKKGTFIHLEKKKKKPLYHANEHISCLF